MTKRLCAIAVACSVVCHAETPPTFLRLRDAPHSYTGQALKGVRVNAAANALEFYVPGSGGSVAWGAILGTLSDQTDLQTALDGKVDENAGIVGATKTKITYDAKGLVTAGADATTADISDSLNRRYVTDAQRTVITNTSGTNTGDQDLSGLVSKTTTVNGHALSANVTVTPSDLSLVIGTNVEAWDTDLDTWATKTPYAGTLTITTLKTFNVTNTLTLSGTDGSTLNVGGGGALGSNAFTSTAYVPTSRSLTVGPTTADLSADRTFLANVTNDAQTKSAIVPNTAPSSGQVLIGNAGGTAYAPKSVSGSGATFSLSDLGVLTISAIANASLLNSAITIAGTSTALGGTIAQDTITGLSSTGLVKRTAANTLTTITDNSATWATGGWTALKVAGSDFTTSSTTLVDITGLVSSTLSTATLYEVEADLYVNSTSTAGVAVGVQQSGGGTGQIGVWSGTATSATATGIVIGSNALNQAGAPCVLVAADGHITFRGFIKTGSSGTPTISCKILKTTSGTAKVYIGSTFRFRAA